MRRLEELLLATVSGSREDLVGDAATHLLKAGGKRVRPALTLISSRAGEPGARGTDLSAAALELVHVATLYHDDVIDKTETRRGVATVHSKWGIDIAVLAGDFLFAKGCGLGAEAGGRVPAILARAIADVCEGQIGETARVGDVARSLEHYFWTIERKTAALFEAACELGAVTAGAAEDDVAALALYGRELGIGFQIADDLLDVVGDPEVTGKEPGTDVRKGVYTLPVLIAFERRAELRDAARNQAVEAVLAGVVESGAAAEARRLAEARIEAAVGHLQRFGSADWAEALADTARRVFEPLR